MSPTRGEKNSFMVIPVWEVVKAEDVENVSIEEENEVAFSKEILWTEESD